MGEYPEWTGLGGKKRNSWKPASDEVVPTLLQIKFLWHFAVTCTHFHSGSTCPDSQNEEIHLRARSPHDKPSLLIVTQLRLKGLHPDLCRKVNYLINVQNNNGFHKVPLSVQFTLYLIVLTHFIRAKVHLDSFSPKWVNINGFPLWLDFKSVSCRKNSHFCFSVIYQSLTTPGPAIRIPHIVSQPWHFVTKGSNYTRKGLLTPMHQRVLRVNSVFQSKNIITLPAHLKKWRVWNAHGWTGTFLGALRPSGQGNSDTSLHTPLRRDAWYVSAPQKARQAWLLAVFGSFSAERGETDWCKQKGWAFC